MYPHVINLKAPWDAQPLTLTRLRRDGVVEAVDGPVPPPLKMIMPGRWADRGLPGFQGKVRFRRGFAWPKPLASYERLWLVVGAADYFASVSVNGEKLGDHAGAFEPFEFEITRLAQKKNELVIDADCPKADPEATREWLWRGKLGPGGGLWGVVSLEVRREAFLKLERIEPRLDAGFGQIRLVGQVVAENKTKLDLSVRLAGRELSYRPAVGGPFDLTLEAGVVEPWRPGAPRLHELLVQLNDVACQLDQKAFQIGFRSGEIEGEAVTLPWSQPAGQMTMLEQADQEGKLVVLEAPVRPAVIQNPERRAEAERLFARLAASVARHACVAEFSPKG